MNTTLVETVITSVKRRANTADGNPRWELNTEAGVFRTADDSQSSHQVSDWTEGARSLIVRAGRVVYILDPEAHPDERASVLKAFGVIE